jgi:hypothetical protein
LADGNWWRSVAGRRVGHGLLLRSSLRDFLAFSWIVNRFKFSIDNLGLDFDFSN